MRCVRFLVIVFACSQVTFEYMKNHKNQYQPISVKWKNNFEFIRKGVVGDSASLFSDEQHQLYDNMLKEEFPDGLPPWL